MSFYRVAWTIDVEADDPVSAARKALEIQRDPESIATCFEVRAGNGSPTFEVDILDTANPICEVSV